VILVTIDTLRADHLSSYGYARPTSPFLDRLAKEGVLFEEAFAASSMTAPCHAALFTGLYPLQNGVRMNDQGFAAADKRPFRTLAETLAAAGWDTAAFSGVGFLKSISQGFAVKDLGSGDFSRYRQADQTVSRAVAWLQKPRERFFLWLHLFDVHPPRKVPPKGVPRLFFASPEEAQRFASDQITRLGVSESAFKSRTEMIASYSEYDDEIRFVDHELERLSAAVEDLHLKEETLWIVTADHGEGLGNHSWLDHVRYLYNEAVQVPLIVSWNGRWAGSRVRNLVRHVDVMPTLLSLLGLPFEQKGATPPGRSVVPLLEGGKMSPVFSFSIRRPWGTDHKDWEKGEVYALQDLDWKYILHTEGHDEFFDLRKDPLELENQIGGASPVKDRLADLTRRTFGALLREAHAPAHDTDPAVTSELKSLGYVQ
jgi:arylsulfatase A-like enzyme